MTRGNQRDLAREKNLKKMQEKSKGQRNDELSLAQRREIDAERIRRKQAECAARKAGQNPPPAS